MKRHFFVTKTSDRYTLDYILRFKDGVARTVRLPAPLVFDFSRRNGFCFSVSEFDEITGRYQFHDLTEGVEPDEEEHVVYPPVQEETVTPWGEGSSSGWGRDLPLPRGRNPGLQCTHRRTHTTHGHTSTTQEEEAPQDRNRRAPT